MTAPLTDQQLDTIEQRAAHLYEYDDLPDDAEILAGTDVPALLAEVARLRADLQHQDGEARFWEFEYREAMDNYRGEAQHAKQLRADLTQARAAAPLLVDRSDLTELAAILDAERYRLDKGDGSPVPQPRWGANVRISQAVQAALTGGDPPHPSPEHSAVYMDGDRQVWSEYKTVPESNAVLPLVWAAEQTSSREELADQGVVLRIVGWIK